jgi:hypothetical protein
VLTFFLCNEMKQIAWKNNQLWHLSYYKFNGLQCIGTIEENDWSEVHGKNNLET